MNTSIEAMKAAGCSSPNTSSIVHNAVVIEMGDVNIRELTVGKSI